MKRYKINPRVLSTSELPRPNNFFYRLFSSQRFLAIVGLSFLLLIIFPLAKSYTQSRLVEQEIKEAKKEIDEYQQTNQELKEMINYLSSDQSLEDQARLNLNLKKPGEKVIVINDLKIETSTPEINKTTSPESNFAKWWSYFFD